MKSIGLKLARTNPHKVIYQTTQILFLQYVLVTIAMMFYYSGGHRYAPELTHFVWDQNYLSDLGRSVNYAGNINPNYLFYSLTLGMIGIGIYLFFLQITFTLSHKTKYFVHFFGLLTAIGYIGIAIYPADINLNVHVKFAHAAFFGFFITSVLAHILLDKSQFKTTNICLTILNVLLLLYLILLFFGPNSSQGAWVLQLKTVAQKIVVYSQIILCLTINRNLHQKS